MKLINRLFSDAPLIEHGALTALLLKARTMELPHSLRCDSGTRSETVMGEDGLPAASVMFEAAEHPFLRRMRESMKPQVQMTEDGLAVIPVEGVLARKPDAFEMLMGVEDSLNVLAMVQSAASNPQVRGVLLDVDSPGGFLTGGPEIAEAVRQMDKTKPCMTWTGGDMCSLAYWIGSQGSQVIASRSAQVGSIGVYATHVDYSKLYEAAGLKVEVFKNKEADYKAAGVMGTTLTEAQRGHIQEGVQASFGDFRRAVTSQRPAAQDDSMRGQVFTGPEAQKAGLVDRIGGMGFALNLLRREIAARA